MHEFRRKIFTDEQIAFFKLYRVHNITRIEGYKSIVTKHRNEIHLIHSEYFKKTHISVYLKLIQIANYHD